MIVLSMIVHIVDVEGVAIFKSKNDAPVAVDRHGMEAISLAFQQVRAVAGKVHIHSGCRCIEPCKDAAELFSMARHYATMIAGLE